MRTTLFILCLLCAAGAFGQSAGTVALTSNVQFPDHPQHATPQGLGQEQNLTQGFGSVYVAQGEMPLADVPLLPAAHVVPLGDVARALKKEHEAVKKAQFVWAN